MSYSTFSVLRHLRKNRINKKGEAPIYIRVTIDGKRSEISTHEKVKVEKWAQKKQKVKGHNQVAKSINEHLFQLENKIRKLHSDLVIKNGYTTPQESKEHLYHNPQKQHTVDEIFQPHNEKIKKKIGNGFARGTYIKYRTIRNHFINFLKKERNREDIELDKVDYKLISDFYDFMKIDFLSSFGVEATNSMGGGGTRTADYPSSARICSIVLFNTGILFFTMSHTIS